MNSPWFLWDVFINVLEYTIFYFLLKQKLGFAENKKISVILATAVMVLIQTALNYYSVNSLIVMNVMYAVMIVNAVVFFRGTTAMRVMWCSAMASINIISGTSVSLIMANMGLINIQTALNPSVARMFPTSLYIVICFILFLIVLHFPKADFDLPKNIQAIIVVVSVSCCVLGGEMQFLARISSFTDAQNSVYALAIIVLSVFLLCFYYVIHKTGEFFFKDTEYQNQIRSMEIEAKNNEQMQAIISAWNHDSHHHITVLNAFANNNEMDKIKLYLREMQTDIEESATLINTGNPALDAILSKTFRICRLENIVFRIQVNKIGVLPISDKDISSLAGNMLDNAMDACKAFKSEDAKPFIDFHVYRRQKMIVISVSNSTNGIYNYDGDEIKTTQDAKWHGYGLKRIRQITEKADGFVHIKPGDTIFKIEVCIPDINGGNIP